MTMTPVTSSNIAAIGYEQGTLAVQFHDGAEWEYYVVPSDLYYALMAAESKGRYFKNNIRGQFAARRIR